MILDRQNQYSDAQALSASAASTDVIDHGVSSDLGTGEPMVVMLNVEVAADGANADETYNAALQVDDNSGFSSPAAIGDVDIPRTAVAGDKFYIDVPAGVDVEQFSRINYTLGGTTPSITLSAHLIPKSFIEERRDYASGFTVA